MKKNKVLRNRIQDALDKEYPQHNFITSGGTFGRSVYIYLKLPGKILGIFPKKLYLGNVDIIGRRGLLLNNTKFVRTVKDAHLAYCGYQSSWSRSIPPPPPRAPKRPKQKLCCDHEERLHAAHAKYSRIVDLPPLDEIIESDDFNINGAL